MTPALYGVIGVLFLIDAPFRRWRPFKTSGLKALAYLLLPYVPLVLLPLASRRQVTAMTATVALGALLSYARMVGLAHYHRFYIPTLLSAALFYAGAHFGLYPAFQALPVLGLLLVLLVATLGGSGEAFLQKLCLSWLGILVYGYFWAHAVLIVTSPMPATASGPLWLACVLLCAKFADVAWVVVGKIFPDAALLQIASSATGGFLGALTLRFAVGQLLPPWQLLLLGAAIGATLGVGARAFNYIVSDVVGDDVERPLKGAMMFGFAFSLAVAFHALQLVR